MVSPMAKAKVRAKVLRENVKSKGETIKVLKAEAKDKTEELKLLKQKFDRFRKRQPGLNLNPIQQGRAHDDGRET